jgi:hypothetical protein
LRKAKKHMRSLKERQITLSRRSIEYPFQSDETIFTKNTGSTAETVSSSTRQSGYNRCR